MAIWPIIVIGALNIENKATDAGFGKISPDDIRESSAVTGVYDALVSDTALHIVLFLAGGAVFAWVSHLLEKLDQGSSSWTVMWTGAFCQGAAECFEKNGFNRKFSNMAKDVPKLNRRLERLGLRTVEFNSDDEDRNKAYARYLRAITGPLQMGDLEYAKALGEAALSLEQGRLSPPR